jgi:hypothetical protein
MTTAKFSDLKGLTLTSITGIIGDEMMQFNSSDGKIYQLYHYQDCCEQVRIEDITGDLEDLLNTPILLAEESTGETPAGVKEPFDSYTWTFYKLATIKGYVDIRWLGESNGWYSERVDFRLVEDQN